MSKKVESKDSNINRMMAEDYFALEKYGKAIEKLKKTEKGIPKKRLEEFAKSALIDGDIDGAVVVFEEAGTNEEDIREAFINMALEVLNRDYLDLEKLKKILSAVDVNPAENETIRNRLVEIAREMTEKEGDAGRVLEIYEFSGAEILEETMIDLVVSDIKNGNKHRREKGIEILKKFKAIEELREIAKYFLSIKKPNEKTARLIYEAIIQIEE